MDQSRTATSRTQCRQQDRGSPADKGIGSATPSLASAHEFASPSTLTPVKRPPSSKTLAAFI
jgi:hypothetical protein